MGAAVISHDTAIFLLGSFGGLMSGLLTVDVVRRSARVRGWLLGSGHVDPLTDLRAREPYDVSARSDQSQRPVPVRPYGKECPASGVFVRVVLHAARGVHRPDRCQDDASPRGCDSAVGTNGQHCCHASAEARRG